MAEHIYNKSQLKIKLEDCIGKTLGDIDTYGVFESIKNKKKVTGIAGTVIERNVLDYAPDPKQEPDIILKDGEQKIHVEVKVTGLEDEKKRKNERELRAKEPMSITAVGIYDISDQSFETSHFWSKLEHLLIIYYKYDYCLAKSGKKTVEPYFYKDFKIITYDLYSWNDKDKAILRKDWEYVHELCSHVKDVTTAKEESKNKKWKADFKAEYIKEHDILRNELSYTDLAPKYPPRFRLRKNIVTYIYRVHQNEIAVHSDETDGSVQELDNKLLQLTYDFKDKTIEQIANKYGINVSDKKNLAEDILVAMFMNGKCFDANGRRYKMKDIATFTKYGKFITFTLTMKGGKSEDTKLIPLDLRDFYEVINKDSSDKEAKKHIEERFEESSFYDFFHSSIFLFAVFQETEPSKMVQMKHNRFIGFKRIVLSEDFIYGPVKSAWEDTYWKLRHHEVKLTPIMHKNSSGALVKTINKSGTVRVKTNFIKSSENPVFIRGDSRDSSEKSRNMEIDGQKMIRQYIWLHGNTVIGLINGK